MLTREVVAAAVRAWPYLYETREGVVYVGCAVSGINEALRGIGYQRVPKLDAYELKRLGCEVVDAQYVGGARKTGRFVETVVIQKMGG